MAFAPCYQSLTKYYAPFQPYIAWLVDKTSEVIEIHVAQANVIADIAAKQRYFRHFLLFAIGNQPLTHRPTAIDHDTPLIGKKKGGSHHDRPNLSEI